MPDPETARMQVESYFDEATSIFSHLVLDTRRGACALIDSVWDYDPKTGRTSTRHAHMLIARVRALGAQVQWLLETHVHADHLSATDYLKRALGGQIAMGAGIVTVLATFGEIFNAGPDFTRDGSHFDRLLVDGEAFEIGMLRVRAMHTPGHPPACMTDVVEDADSSVAFVGDTLFMPDYGTARCDFPGGDAAALYHAVQRVLALPAATRLYLCHDYPPTDRPTQAWSTVAAQRAGNVHVHEGVTEAAFVAMRQARDATLDMPVLLPPPEANGVSYLKIPINAL